MIDLFSLDGRVALVTGSSRGIGLALARALAQAGATVVLNARSAGPLDAAVASVGADGHAVHAAPGDVTDPAAVEAIVESIERDVGPIDVLVNNAGIQRRAPLLDVDLGDWQDLLDVNLTGPFVTAQSVARRMVGRGRGKIVNVSSVMAQVARPTVAPYAATKGGLKMLTQSMCADLGPAGIQVNALAPGYFETELTRALVDDREFSAWVAGRTPAGRWGRVDELGGAIVFLASDASSYVNGQTLIVDGGMTAVL